MIGYISVSARNVQQLQRSLAGLGRNDSQHSSHAAEATKIPIQTTQVK
jgi:hypothetical protein